MRKRFYCSEVLILWTWATLKQTNGLGHRAILDDETVVKETLAFMQT